MFYYLLRPYTTIPNETIKSCKMTKEKQLFQPIILRHSTMNTKFQLEKLI
jgi:hypothetical protein